MRPRELLRLCSGHIRRGASTSTANQPAGDSHQHAGYIHHPEVPRFLHNMSVPAAQLLDDFTSRSTGEGLSAYLHDIPSMRHALRDFSKTMPQNVSVYYAVKANANRAVVAEMANLANAGHLAGVELASLGEVRMCSEYFNGSQMIVGGPSKSEAALMGVLEAGVRQIHVESYTEVERLEYVARQLGKPVEVLLRINPNFDTKGIPFTCQMGQVSSKFGVDEEVAEKVVQRIQSSDWLRFKGIQTMGGCGFQEASQYLRYVDFVLGLLTRIPALAEAERVNLGGGFGIDYSLEGKGLDMHEVGRGLCERLTGRNADREFILEPGRWLVGPYSYYVTPVLDIKVSGGKPIVLVAGGYHHLYRPVHCGNHPLEVVPGLEVPKYLSQVPRVERSVVDIGGALQSPSDFLARDQFVESLAVGDYLVFGYAGAYGIELSPTNFLMHAQPVMLVPQEEVLSQPRDGLKKENIKLSMAH